MREIKFRAWHENGTVEKIGKRFKTSPGMVYDEKPGDCLTWKNQGQPVVAIMQFTGVKDRTGKEIYEGDILDGHSDGFVKVEWCDAGWMCSFDDLNLIGLDEMCIWFGNHSIIIGNIYENPDLLQPSPDREVKGEDDASHDVA